MIQSKFATYFKASIRLFFNRIKLSIFIVCLLSITFDYTAAKDNFTPNSADQNSVGNTTSFSFIVWGHPRGVNDGDPPLLFSEFTELVVELKPDFIVITGDMIHGRIGRIEEQKALLESDWDFFDKCVSVLGVPIYRLPGNHDVSNQISRDIYTKRYPQPPYSFAYKGSRFILLDSIGIKQLANDSGAIWGHGAMPFDKEQIDFIKNEISNQEKYNHIFFFMHHTSPWSESESFWWNQIHPLLFKSKTRAVFSGDNPSYMKFAHIEQDGIHYLLNNSYPTREVNYYRRFGTRNLYSTMTQLDNIQFVQVNGNKVKYKTHVFGELSKESSSWRYYDRIEKELSKLSTWQGRMLDKLKAKLFYRLRSFALVFTVWGCVFFLLGIFFTLFLIRSKNKI